MRKLHAIPVATIYRSEQRPSPLSKGLAGGTFLFHILSWEPEKVLRFRAFETQLG